jgi:hypothetical protein
LFIVASGGFVKGAWMEGLGELEFVSRPKKKPNKKMATMPKAKYFFISSYLSVAFVAYCYQRLKVLFL